MRKGEGEENEGKRGVRKVKAEVFEGLWKGRVINTLDFRTCLENALLNLVAATFALQQF